MQISKNTAAETVFNGFPGTDLSAPLPGETGAEKVKNFRILPDGSLVCRPGFADAFDFDGEIRAMAQNPVNDRTYVLAGNTVYYLDFSFLVAIACNTPVNGTRSACFFSYAGSFYLLDGASLRIFNGSYFEPVYGYVPLYGKNWHPTLRGAIHERLNLMSSRVRITYAGTGTPDRLETGFSSIIVNRLTVNGTVIPSSQYTVSGGTVMCSSLGTDSAITLCLTIDDRPMQDMTLTPAVGLSASATAQAIPFSVSVRTRMKNCFTRPRRLTTNASRRLTTLIRTLRIFISPTTAFSRSATARKPLPPPAVITTTC